MPKLNSLLFAALVTLGFLVPLTASSKAYAICDEPRTVFKITNGHRTQRGVLYSAWMEAGFHASYQETSTAQWNASVNASVTAEAGVIFAKASTTLGITVGKTWGKTRAWSYTGPVVPRRKEGRLVMYHEGRGFTVTKQSLRSPCNYVNVWSYAVNVPTMRGDDVWRMQYRNARRGQGAPPVDGELPGEGFDEEIDLGLDPGSGEEGDPVDDDADAMPEEMTLAVPAAVDGMLTFASIVAGSLNLA